MGVSRVMFWLNMRTAVDIFHVLAESRKALRLSNLFHPTKVN